MPSAPRIVDDVEPFEKRKLWLLNGAHSLLAYAGSVRGHDTVADAIADPTARAWVEQWWDAASRHLTLPPADVAAYRQALLERFSNPAIRHLLAQIAADGSQKIPIRAVPVIAADLQQGRVDPGATRLLAAWITHLRGHGAPVTDPRSPELRDLVAGTPREAAERVLVHLGLPTEPLCDTVAGQVAELEDSHAPA